MLPAFPPWPWPRTGCRSEDTRLRGCGPFLGMAQRVSRFGDILLCGLVSARFVLAGICHGILSRMFAWLEQTGCVGVSDMRRVRKRFLRRPGGWSLTFCEKPLKKLSHMAAMTRLNMIGRSQMPGFLLVSCLLVQATQTSLLTVDGAFFRVTPLFPVVNHRGDEQTILQRSATNFPGTRQRDACSVLPTKVEHLRRLQAEAFAIGSLDISVLVFCLNTFLVVVRRCKSSL